MTALPGEQHGTQNEGRRNTTRCGIDLGTTYSAISWYDEVAGRVEHIALDSQDGEELMQSAVYIEPDGNIVVGEAAAHAAWQHPERFFAGFKQAMGTDWKSASVDGREYTAPDLSAIILERLVKDAQAYLGSPVDEVVVTVPAYFGHQEREDTKAAAKLAGLNLIELLAEPHAAALAFAVDRIDDIRGKTLLVFDLGGGTFDVVLMRGQVQDSDDVIHLDAEIVHKEGDRELGGMNWDNVLCDLVADKVVDEHGHDPRDDVAEAAVLKVNVEQAKRKLSTASSWTVAPGSQAQVVTVTRDEFETETSGLLAQTAAMLQKVLDHVDKLRQENPDDATLNPENIEVLLCGGSTRMPAVREMIEEKIGKPPLMHRNPELLVTTGAAYRAYLAGEAPDVLTTRTEDEDGNIQQKGLIVSAPVDVARLAVGIEVHANPEEVAAGTAAPRLLNQVVIEEDSPFGQIYERTFSAAYDGMTEVPIILYEGPEGEIGDRQPVARLKITGFSAGMARGTPVHVELQYDQDGIITGRAEAEGRSLDIRVEPGRAGVTSE